MFLLCLTLSLFCVCSSSESIEMCYGSSYTLDLGLYGEDFHGSVFFTPTIGRIRRLVMENGKSMDPRFKTNSQGGLIMPDLTEQDNGEFSVIFLSGDQPKPLSTLGVSECGDLETSYYGNAFSLRVPRGAEFLEFTPVNKLEQVTVIWNRTDPNGGRGSVTRSYWKITDITHEDSGYYKFRAKNNRLLTWKKLSVNVDMLKFDLLEGESFQMPYHAEIETVTFEPLKESYYHPSEERLERYHTGGFEERMEFQDNAISVGPVIAEDSGVFMFRDEEGNLVLRVYVDVTFSDEIPVWMYALEVSGVIFGMIFCCCCIKKCCCKKSSSKRNNPAPQSAAAPDVNYHAAPQHTSPGYSSTTPAPVYSHQSVNAPVYREPTSTCGGSQAAAPGGQGAPPLPSNMSDVISTNSGPRFEVKGYFSSASPLSSDSVITDVYSSDKLNFL